MEKSAAGNNTNLRIEDKEVQKELTQIKNDIRDLQCCQRAMRLLK